MPNQDDVLITPRELPPPLPGASLGGGGPGRKTNEHVDFCPENPNKVAPGICGCDVLDSDADLDGIFDCNDNSTDLPNADQIDRDGDGDGDVCDNCAAISNSDQINVDGDALGAACDCNDSQASIAIPPTGASGVTCDTGEASPCDEGQLFCVSATAVCRPLVSICETQEYFAPRAYRSLPQSSVNKTEFSNLTTDNYPDYVLINFALDFLFVYINSGNGSYQMVRGY